MMFKALQTLFSTDYRWSINKNIKLSHLSLQQIFHNCQLKSHYSKSQIFVQKFNFDQNPNIFTSFSPKIFLTICLVKSKLNFWTKNEDFEQCALQKLLLSLLPVMIIVHTYFHEKNDYSYCT